MSLIEHVKESIFSPLSENAFESLALSLFEEQYQSVPPYRTYCDFIGKTPGEVSALNEVPFLPVNLFKNHKILHRDFETKTHFVSSGTTGTRPSIHWIPDLAFYTKCFSTQFKRVYGDINQYVILALLPSYLERSRSSLVFMAQSLIEQSGNPHSGFYLDKLTALRELMHELSRMGEKILLLGVSYALIDLAESGSWELNPETIIIETGGMKGKRIELTKSALHQKLSESFGLDQIQSEYGMTELMSQAYAIKDGLFQTPEWMRVITRDPEDPMTIIQARTGGLNIVDLANVYSCAFIATQDLAFVQDSGHFSLMGRFDHSDLRGCNLLLDV